MIAHLRAIRDNVAQCIEFFSIPGVQTPSTQQLPVYIMRLKAIALLAAAQIAVLPALAQADAATDKIRSVLQSTFGISADSVEPAAVEGLYEVAIGPRFYYVSADGKYLLQGRLMNLETGEDLTAAKEGAARAATIAALGKDNMLTFPAKNEKHNVTVFTDIDCGYCRKLHAEMEDLNARGITVNYLFYPRSGPNTPSYHKAEAVWCSKDQQDAMTRAKAGKDVSADKCETPIDEHMRMVALFGLRGTPAIVLDNGEVLPGYYPAPKLEALLNGETAKP